MPTAELAVPLCAECKTPGGYTLPGRPRPMRVSGAPFGVQGRLCYRCYEDRRNAALRALRRGAGPQSEELERRIAAVRAVKERKRPNGPRHPVLTPEELNKVLPL